ncbi:MAG: hypothetical protein J6Z49_09170 [Kiritimatiellae bacterium]|nr:hypothetical protein [Kiritimatiellia bacterium]
MKRIWTAALSALLLTTGACALDHETRTEGKAAIQKGLAWLVAKQKDDGSWSNERFPALTGLPLWALSEVASEYPEYAANIAAAVAYLKDKAQPDGGIYVPDPRRGGAGLGNYNTSVCMMAFQATGRKDVIPLILKAREFTANTQLTGDDVHAGGFGYDRNGRRYSDLSNTAMAIDAMRMTESAEEFRPAGEKKADLNWDAALKYVAGMQVPQGREDKGGFVYTKSFARAPSADANGVSGGRFGRPRLQSYGSITYDGLLSLMHCKLTPKDPRVVSALDYCAKHWTLDENPGQGMQGVYFYYDILTRALNASRVDTIECADGKKVDWRAEVIRKVVSLQKREGYWTNANNRWWENDPVLATSYSLICLEHALKQAK